jgi:hypothetical protein
LYDFFISNACYISHSSSLIWLPLYYWIKSKICEVHYAVFCILLLLLLSKYSTQYPVV